MSTRLSSTEATSIDLVAMRNWHFLASVDKERTPFMRRWHRGQVRVINARIPRSGPGSLTLVKVALIELLAGEARKNLHRVVERGGPFDWREMCAEAIRDLENEEHLGKTLRLKSVTPQ